MSWRGTVSSVFILISEFLWLWSPKIQRCSLTHCSALCIHLLTCACMFLLHALYVCWASGKTNLCQPQVTKIVFHYIKVLRFPFFQPIVSDMKGKEQGGLALTSASVQHFYSLQRLCTESARVHPILKEPSSGCCVAKRTGNKHGSMLQRDNSRNRFCFLEARDHRYLGETGELEKTLELWGEWRLKEWEGECKGEVEVGDTLRGLLRSPLWSFHRSSSFSMDKRLFTLDSFWRDSCSMACSVDNCL